MVSLWSQNTTTHTELQLRHFSLSRSTPCAKSENACAGADNAALAGFSKPRKPSTTENAASKQHPDEAPESGSERRGSQGSDEAQPGVSGQEKVEQTPPEQCHGQRKASLGLAASPTDAPTPNGHVSGGAEVAALASTFQPAMVPPPGVTAGDVAASGKLAGGDLDEDGAKCGSSNALCNGNRALGSHTGFAVAKTLKSGLDWHGSMPADDPTTDATPEAVREADPEAAKDKSLESEHGITEAAAVGGGREGEGVDATESRLG